MTTNQARVKCGKCEATLDMSLATEEVIRQERAQGAEVQYDTTGDVTCACGNEIEYVSSAWEYPEGVPNHQENPKVTGGTLV